MSVPELRIYRERPQGGRGCTTLLYKKEEIQQFPGAANRIAAGQLYMQLKKEYGDKIRVDFYDPRCFIYLLDLFRYRIRADQITWVLNKKVIFRGVPTWEELKARIDAVL